MKFQQGKAVDVEGVCQITFETTTFPTSIPLCGYSSRGPGFLCAYRSPLESQVEPTGLPTIILVGLVIYLYLRFPCLISSFHFSLSNEIIVCSL